MRRMTLIQRRRREEIPMENYNGCIMNGCIPMDDYAEALLEDLESESVAFDAVWEKGEMPVLKFDDAFKQWRQSQIEENLKIAEDRLTCTLPWQVLRHLDAALKDSERLYWTQGGVPSCMSHADVFAWHSAILQMIARGVPLKYVALNSLITWYISKNQSMRGGQTVSEMAASSRTVGHFPEASVGKNNQQAPDKKYLRDPYLEEAKQYQSAILFLKFKNAADLANEIMLSCAAGLTIPCGNSTAVSGSTTDKNGVKIAVLRGRWAHATHFTSYRKVRGTEYVGWVNSHGSKYGVSDEGEPGDMCWMDRSILERFCATMSGYGPPYLVFPESVTRTDWSFYVKAKIPFPDKWRT